MSFERRCVSVILGVQSIVEELKFMHDKLEEAQAVIKQLSEGLKPGEPILIHPADLSELIDKSSPIDFSFETGKNPDEIDHLTEIAGTKYKQSVLMPVKSTAVR